MAPLAWAKIVAQGASQSPAKGGADCIDTSSDAANAGVKGDNLEKGRLSAMAAVDSPKTPTQTNEGSSQTEKGTSGNKGEAAAAASAAVESSSAEEAPRETEAKAADRRDPTAAPSKAPSKPAWNTDLIASAAKAASGSEPSRPPLADIQQGASSAPWPSLHDSKTQPKRSKSPPEAEAPKDMASSADMGCKGSQQQQQQQQQHNHHQSRQFASHSAGRHHRQQHQGGPMRHGSRNDRYNNGHGTREGGRGRRSYNNMNNNHAAYYAYGPSREYVMEAVRAQIEYYFSVENLCKDLFLRSKMDPNGYIAMDVVASFNRVRMLSTDLPFIIESLKSSSAVEFSEDNVSLRVASGHEQWVLPPEQLELAKQLRSPTARSDMSEASTPTDGSKENYVDSMDDSSSSKTSGSSDGMDDIAADRSQGQNQMSLNLFGDAAAKGCDVHALREAVPMTVVPSTAAGA